MPRPIDLHMHTVHSDGVLSPAELLDRVRAAKVSAFSVTDHDTLSGWHEVAKLLVDGDPELVAGTELSARIDDDDLHILAYCFDPDDPALNRALEVFQERRGSRGREMVERLQKLGLHVTFGQVTETAAGGVIGRPHVAETLYRLGLTKQYEEAFWKYIGNGGPAYVPKVRLEPQDAFDLVHAAGGVAVLAHPAIGDMWRHIEALVPLGLDGVEAWHYSHSPADVKRAKQVAKSHQLILSGGSDFHGRGAREAPVGALPVPPEFLETMKKRTNRYRG
jgi:predicted metal-dependent phosphoesterase TrpH